MEDLYDRFKLKLKEALPKALRDTNQLVTAHSKYIVRVIQRMC